MSVKLCDCGHPPSPSSISSGHGTDSEGKTYCYACCAKNDREWMRENGKMTLYVSRHLNEIDIINWPGSLRFSATRYKESKHSAFGRLVPRLDVWFMFEGEEWHGVQRGIHNDLCACRKKKGANNGKGRK